MIAKGGHTMDGVAGVGMVVPVVPLIVLSILAYILSTHNGGEEGGQQTDSSLEELRSAYARGELSDEEFENRRDRLRPQRNGGPQFEMMDRGGRGWSRLNSAGAVTTALGLAGGVTY